MSFADEWEAFPEFCGAETSAPVKARKINTDNFDKEYESFVAHQKKMKAERLAKEAEEKAKHEAESQPTEAVAEEAYQAFVEEAEKPKSKKKKKTEEVVEETSAETPVVED